MDGDLQAVFAAEPPVAIGHLCRRWLPASQVQRPLARGFSGADVWLVEEAGSRFVLKMFPLGTTPERARWIHAQMLRARAAGLSEVPALQFTETGDSIVVADGCLWELMSFVTGHPASQPTAAQIAAALTVLARLHQAGAEPVAAGESAAIRQRVTVAQRMLERPWAELLANTSSHSATPGQVSLQRAVRERLAAVVSAWGQKSRRRWLVAVAEMAPHTVSGQWVLRDIWSDHVLFSAAWPPCVAGLIDYHASGIDTAATDVARLLGSWIDAEAVQPAWWEAHLVDYGCTSPLPVRDQALIPFLAASGVVFGLDNWFRWTLEEGRQFGSSTRVTGRIDRLVKTLPTVLNMLDGWAIDRV